MLNREAEELLADVLVEKINSANEKILQAIGTSLALFDTIKPSQAYQLSQILKYGGSYEEIARTLAKVSGRNVSDIYKIFQQIAKDNKQFAKEFYRYRGIDFIPYEQDTALKRQVDALASITNNTYKNMLNSNVVGYIYDDIYGNKAFKTIQDTYYDLIDRATLNVIQGKETFDTELKNTLKQIGGSGLITYESGRTRRLDSAVRMNVQDSIRKFNQELTRQFGAEYGADGVEITVHLNPAPDHADTQGKQFSIEEYEKLQTTGYAKDVNGNTHDLHRELKSGEEAEDFRPIGELNCYHRILNIIIGVSKPQYTEEQLQKINEANEKGFEYEGKHYTNYEGTQLQRKLETAIRQQKDEKILAESIGQEDMIQEANAKIKLLTKKYNELSKASGLKRKPKRMQIVRR